jgi:hypothetical protein
MKNESLNAVLESLGYCTQPAGMYKKHILTSEGDRAFTGDASQVWQWLKESGKLATEDEQMELLGAIA